MTLTDQQQTELRDLIDALCEDTLTDESAARLEALVVEHDEACRYYLDYLNLHGALSLENGGDPFDAAPTLRQPLETDEDEENVVTGLLGGDGTSAEAASPVPLSLLGRWSNLGQRGIALLCHPSTLSVVVGAMAIGSLLTMLAFWTMPMRRAAEPAEEAAAKPVYVARLVRTVDCIWANNKAVPLPGTFLKPQRRLELVEGVAEITFDSGARVYLQGPATFETDSRNAARLRVGRLTAVVPEPARGFELQTPLATITDLGTEFGVAVDSTGVAEVHVTQGKVALAAGGAVELLVEAGQGARIGAGGHIESAPFNPAEVFTWSQRRAAGFGGIRQLPATATINLVASALQADPIVVNANPADAETQEIIPVGTPFTGVANIAPKDAPGGIAGTGRALNYNDSQAQTRTLVIPFLLPDSLAGKTVDSASLNLRLAEINRSPNFNCDVYGLRRIAAFDPTVVHEDHFLGPLDNSNTLLADDFVTSTSSPGDHVISGPTLSDFLNAQLAAGAAGKYVFIRVNADLDGNNITEPQPGERCVEYRFFTANSNVAPTPEADPAPKPENPSR